MYLTMRSAAGEFVGSLQEGAQPGCAPFLQDINNLVIVAEAKGFYFHLR